MCMNLVIVCVRYNYVVIDKSDPPRSMVHEQRNDRTSALPFIIPIIKDDTKLHYGSEYASLLADNEYKMSLIKYLSIKFLEFSLSASMHARMIVIDSPAFGFLRVIRNGKTYKVDSNEHGEADYAIWYHIMKSDVSNVMVVSKDTDTWVYGLSLMELGFLSGKHVIIKRGINASEYVSINFGVRAIMGLPCLSNVKYPATSIVALYILSGCDYVSSFFHITKKTFLEIFLQHANYICAGSKAESLVCIDDNMFCSIELDSFIRLVCTVYLMKRHKSVLNGVALDQFHASFINQPISNENMQLLSWLSWC